MNFRSYLPGFLRFVPTLYLVGGAIAIAAVVILGIHYVTKPTVNDQLQTTGTPHVQLATVGELSAEAGPLSVVGSVTSEDQATILAQTSGEIVSLSRSIGDHVSAGQVIGEFENSSQRAAVTQAEGSLEAAQAALSKATGTTAANSGITSSQASTAAQNAATSLSASLKSAYSSLDDAVHTKADALFNNPHTSTPTLLPFTVPDQQLVINIQNERVGLDALLEDTATAASEASPSDDTAAIALKNAQEVESFLNDLLSALNQAVPNSYESSTAIVADQTSISAARSEVIAALSTITTAKSSYDAALASAQTASNSATGGTESDIAAAEASVKTAQGALQAAQANLEKTIIRSPISGTIVSLPVSEGDFVSSFAQVAIVSNPGALYVETQVTPDDAKTLAIGNVATVNSSIEGSISFVAPALDPSTGKIEVKVALSGSTASLTDGETVSLELGRNKTEAAVQGGPITIPIVAVKIRPDGPVVFTVSASSTLSSNPVQLGSILGDRVVITSGLSSETSIVTDARGLSEGESVIVDSAPPLSS